MIPTIEEIIFGLLSGNFTGKQAEAWIREHMKLSAQEGDGLQEFPPLGLAAQPEDGDAVTWNFPILHFGHGAIEVGDATWNGLNALFFGADGQGLGVERDRNEPAKDKETLLMFTFKNLEGLKALEDATARVRATMESKVTA